MRTGLFLRRFDGFQRKISMLRDFYKLLQDAGTLAMTGLWENYERN